MASTNFKKTNCRSLGRMRKHFDQELRQTMDHTNPDIDQTRTRTNYTIGTGSFAETVNRTRDRVIQADQKEPPVRKKKDRVTAVLVNTPCPKEIERMGGSARFFELVHSNLERAFGKENVHGTFVHQDEVHTYRDKDGSQRESLVHSHSVITPYVPGKGINGKLFLTPAKLREFHQELDDQVFREFGIHMLTGEEPGHKTIDQLKQESRDREIQARHEELIGQGKLLRASFDRLQKQIEDPDWVDRKIAELARDPEVQEEWIRKNDRLIGAGVVDFEPDPAWIRKKAVSLNEERKRALYHEEGVLLEKAKSLNRECKTFLDD